MEQKERKREICASVTNRLKLHVGHDEKYAIPFAHRGTTGNFNFNNLCPKSSSTRKNIDYFCVLNLKNKIKRCPPPGKKNEKLTVLSWDVSWVREGRSSPVSPLAHFVQTTELELRSNQGSGRSRGNKKTGLGLFRFTTIKKLSRYRYVPTQ